MIGFLVDAVLLQWCGVVTKETIEVSWPFAKNQVKTKRKCTLVVVKRLPFLGSVGFSWNNFVMVREDYKWSRAVWLEELYHVVEQWQDEGYDKFMKGYVWQFLLGLLRVKGQQEAYEKHPKEVEAKAWVLRVLQGQEDDPFVEIGKEPWREDWN